MTQATVTNTEFFPGVKKIGYEGRGSENPLAYKYYDPEQLVAGKTMKEHLRFAVAYWHTFCGTGTDPFGPGTKNFPWMKSSDVLQSAKDKMDAAFELIGKLGVPYYCFHDFDLIAEGKTIAESEKNLQAIVDYAKQKQKEEEV